MASPNEQQWPTSALLVRNLHSHLGSIWGQIKSKYQGHFWVSGGLLATPQAFTRWESHRKTMPRGGKKSERFSTYTHSKSSPPIYKRRPREGCGPAGSIGVACAAVESTGYRLMATVAAPRWALRAWRHAPSVLHLPTMMARKDILKSNSPSQQETGVLLMDFFFFFL